MKLAASVIVRNEADRYLAPFLRHLAAFCDEIRILDDGSSDGWADLLGAELESGVGLPRWFVESHEPWSPIDTAPLDRIHVLRADESAFWQDEGAARQRLLDWTLQCEPDWILSIDADEFVSDGATLRRFIESPAAAVYSLVMQEVWQASEDCLCVRQDGGWREHPVPVLWRVPGPTVLAQDARGERKWRIADRKVAPGREPIAVRDLTRFSSRHVLSSGVDILHFGWACAADRAARHARYVEHDGGRYHNSAHLASILWPDGRVKLDGVDWPAGLTDVQASVLARATRT